MSFKLHTENIPGNLHEAATTINKWGWAEYVIAMDFGTNYTVCVFRMPSDMVKKLRTLIRSYSLAPDHDDPVIK